MENTEKTENKKPTTDTGGILLESFEVFIPRKDDFWHNMNVAAAISFVGLMILAMFIS